MTQHGIVNKLIREGRKEVRDEILEIIEKAEKESKITDFPFEVWAIQTLARVKEVLDGQVIKEDHVPGQPVTGTPMRLPRSSGDEEKALKTAMSTFAEIRKAAPHRKLQAGNVLDGYKDLPDSADHFRLLTPDIAPYSEIRVWMDNKGNLVISFTHGELVIVPASSNLIRINARGHGS